MILCGICTDYLDCSCLHLRGRLRLTPHPPPQSGEINRARLHGQMELLLLTSMSSVTCPSFVPPFFIFLLANNMQECIKGSARLTRARPETEAFNSLWGLHLPLPDLARLHRGGKKATLKSRQRRLDPHSHTEQSPLTFRNDLVDFDLDQSTKWREFHPPPQVPQPPTVLEPGTQVGMALFRFPGDFGVELKEADCRTNQGWSAPAFLSTRHVEAFSFAQASLSKGSTRREATDDKELWCNSESMGRNNPVWKNRRRVFRNLFPQDKNVLTTLLGMRPPDLHVRSVGKHSLFRLFL